MSEEDLIISVLGIVATFGLPALWVVVHYSLAAWKQWQATTLVREMIHRGYTAEEIIQLFQALGYPHKRHGRPLPDLTSVPPAKPVPQAAYPA